MCPFLSVSTDILHRGDFRTTNSEIVIILLASQFEVRSPGSNLGGSYSNHWSILNVHTAILSVLCPEERDSTFLLPASVYDFGKAIHDHITQSSPILVVCVHDYADSGILSNVPDPSEALRIDSFWLPVDWRIDGLSVESIADRHVVRRSTLCRGRQVSNSRFKEELSRPMFELHQSP